MISYRLLRQCYCALKCPISSRSLKDISKNIGSLCKYSTLTSQDTFSGKADNFKGITVDLREEITEQEGFRRKLDDSLKQWAAEERRCIWFKVNIKAAAHIPELAKKGFNFHHARGDFVMMYKWLPVDSKPNLPPACHTNLGVGMLVLNKCNQLLALQEKAYDYPHWKLPGGYVEKGEDIIDAAVREVREETGVESAFESLVTFRHTHNMSFGNSDIYVLLRLKAITEDIVIGVREIKEAKWMDVEEYTSHPHVHKFNRFVIHKALEYKDRNLKLNIKKETVQWSKFTREMNFLVIEDVK